MSKYHILYYGGIGYATTSNNYLKIAVANGYKYLGTVYGKDVSHSGFYLINITDEMKIFAGI